MRRLTAGSSQYIFGGKPREVPWPGAGAMGELLPSRRLAQWMRTFSFCWMFASLSTRAYAEWNASWSCLATLG